MGIKLPINIEHRDVVYEEKPENMALIKLLENKVDDLSSALEKANSDADLLTKQIAALEAARLVMPARSQVQSQPVRTEIKYVDKIVEVEKEVEKVVHLKADRDHKRDIIIALVVSVFWILSMYLVMHH